MPAKKKPTRDLPPDWWCEGQTDLTHLLEEMETDDDDQSSDADPH